MKPRKFTLLATLLLSCSLLTIGNAGAATLSLSPANPAPGSTGTATWGGVLNPTPKDWIGLYRIGAGDRTFIDWIYIPSCIKAPAAFGVPNGSCNFMIPASLPSGSYELRLYANDGFSIRLATSSQFVVPPSPRFVDNGDGTISDIQTGLMWEKKTPCAPPTLPIDGLHCVNRLYTWSSTFPKANGTLFTEFLMEINNADGTYDGGNRISRTHYSDWRVPTIFELGSIMDCTQPNCLSPTFGPTQAGLYWTSTRSQLLDEDIITPGVWAVCFGATAPCGFDVTNFYSTSEAFFARAVRVDR